MTTITVEIPVKTVSESNVREHWAVKAKRAKTQREAARLMLARWKRLGKGKGKISVRLVRLGARNLDSDNLARSFKAIRDGIADAFGIDDGDARFEWQYGQERGPYAVRVEIWV